VLRLNPSALSAALGKQLLVDAAHLRPIFEEQLIPLFTRRLLDHSLQRTDSGSIGLGSALTLFLTAHKLEPRIIAEVGTYIGNSAASIALGAGLSGKPVQLITCDIHPCIKKPLAGISMPEGSAAQVIQGSSTQMFHALAEKKARLDMLHLDGRLQANDIPYLRSLLNEETLIALDDCEGDEKGHMNLDLLRRAGLLKQHVFVEPFDHRLFRTWNMETCSKTGLLLPVKLIRYTRQ